MKYRVFLAISVAILSMSYCLAQEVVLLSNPGLEDYFPGEHKVPHGWYSCGFYEETPPDLHASNTHYSNVNRLPQQGRTYLGMVARSNYTWETIGQRLKTPIKNGHSYEFSIHLAQSPTYEASDRTTGEVVNYDSPIKIRVWGGVGECSRSQLLGETEMIDHEDWRKYDFSFTAEVDFRYIIIEASYAPGTTKPYNGNVLVDNFSHFMPMDAHNEILTADVGK